MRGVGRRQPASVADIGLYLLGVAGMAASITTIWLAMRAVMDIGGFCAEGGPYVIEHPCPENVGLLMFLAFPGLFASGGLMLWKGARIGRPFASLTMLAWPALFVSLGWNFLEYALPTVEHGLILGWLIPGVVFLLMGLAPLYLFWLARGAPGAADPQRAERLRRALERAQRTPSTSRPSTVEARGDLVAQLERLAALRESGALTESEFESAKQALIKAPGTST